MTKMRIPAAICGMLFCTSALAANEPPTNFKGFNSIDLKTVCIFNDSIYSAGASICAFKSTTAQTVLDCVFDPNSKQVRWTQRAKETNCSSN
jgi:hypothetical protein